MQVWGPPRSAFGCARAPAVWGVPLEPLKSTAGDTSAPGRAALRAGSRGRGGTLPPCALPLAPPPGARCPPLPRSPARALLQGGVSSSAHCSRPSARPPRRRRTLGGGGRRGRDGSRGSRRPGRSAQTPPATQPLAAPLPPRSPPRPASAAAAARRDRRSATLRAPGHRPAAAATARPPSAAPTRPPPGRPDPPPARSHLLGAQSQGTMLSALALLLLLLPPASLSVQGQSTTKTTSTTTTVSDKSNPTSPSSSKGEVSTTVKQSTAPASTVITVTTATGKQSTATASTAIKVTTATGKQSTAATSTDTKVSVAGVSGSTSTASSSPTVTPSQAQQSTTVAASATEGIPATDSSTTTTHGQKDDKTTLGPTTTPEKPKTTSRQDETKDKTGAGTQSNHRSATDNLTTKGGSQTTTPSPNQVTTSHTTPALPALTAPTSTHQPTTGSVASKLPGNSSEGPDKTTVASNSAGTMESPSSTFQGLTTTQTPLSDQQTSSKMPATTGTESPPITGTSAPGALQPAHPSPGSVATSPVTGRTSSSSQMDSTASQGSPSHSWNSWNNTVTCEPPQKLNNTMLILNLTKTNLCEQSSPDDKLITILCQAAKATYNSARDQCHVQLIPIQEMQAVAIKEITIQTILPPSDVYELLKGKWDDLKEAGVSGMKLGHQGPPEETEDRFSMPLIITIVCMASFLLLVAALYGCCHQRLAQRKDQQRLTEELQTVENGYHDNPTLEVMETSSEMQEKKVVNLNGELGDSWIVPLDNLTKDDLDEEEDTHL
ncbi:podocalyxin isoform X2 [Equus przewalskii]|uniref:Podocalyxin n=1 Tax=Equus przewalskii TaxID=9798 RepID=A0ABM4P9B7_EQUPR